MKKINNYYVYLLRRPDEMLGHEQKPFYVGKGTGNRAINSTNENHNIYNEYKKDIIKEIKSKKLKVIIDYNSTNLTEDEAYNKEECLILKYGRIDLGTGILTNLTNGGRYNCGLSNETKKKISKSRKGKKLSDAHKLKISNNKLKFNLCSSQLSKELNCLSVADIAKKYGVSQPTIYRHIKNYNI